MPRVITALRRYPAPCTMPTGKRLCDRTECRYHLRGKRRRAAKPPLVASAALPTTCALDVARVGPLTMTVVAALLGVTRQRVMQIEHDALAKLRSKWGRHA